MWFLLFRGLLYNQGFGKSQLKQHLRPVVHWEILGKDAVWTPMVAAVVLRCSGDYMTYAVNILQRHMTYIYIYMSV